MTERNQPGSPQEASSDRLQQDVIRQNAEYHVSRSPSGPGFVEETIRYCNRGLELAYALFQTDMGKKFPEESAETEAMLQEAMGFEGKVEGGLQQKTGTMAVEFALDGIPQKPYIQSSSIAQALTLVAPHIGRPEYVNTFARNQQNFNYASQFERIAKILGTDSPLLPVLAVAYTTQVAKDAAVDTTKSVLNKALRLQGQDSLILEGYRDGIIKQITAIKTHEAYITAGRARLAELALSADLDPERLELVLDIAFMQSSAVESSERDRGKFEKILSPMLEAIRDSKWGEALQQRDFLLRYLGTSFPEWRTRIYQEQISQQDPTQRTTKTLRDVITALEDDTFAGEFYAALPEGSQDTIATMIGKEAKDIEARARREVLYRSLHLTTDIIQQAMLSINVRFDDKAGELMYTARDGSSGLLWPYLRREIPAMSSWQREKLSTAFAKSYYTKNKEAKLKFSLRGYIYAVLGPREGRSDVFEPFIQQAERELHHLQGSASQ